MKLDADFNRKGSTMTGFQFALPATGLALLLSTTGAFAQVTAQNVWDDWKASMAVYGTEGVTIGSETYAGGVLTVTDLAFAMSDETGSVSGNLAQLVMTEQADGTVLVTMSEEYPISFSGTDEFGSVTEVNVSLRQTGLQMVVSGAVGNLTYDMSVPRYELMLNGITEDGTPMDANAVMGINNLTGTYTTSGTDLRQMSYDIASESLDIKAAINDTENNAAFSLSGSMAALSATMDMTLPVAQMEADPDQMFAAGLAMDGGYAFGATEYAFNVTEYGSPTDGTVSVGGGTLEFAISRDAMAYSTLSQNVNAQFGSPDMPFPISFSASEVGFGIAMPMSPTDTPADFSANVNLSAVTVNEEIWAMLDPGAVIPRDPATILIDLAGTARMLVDLTDPAQAGGMAMAGAPGELHSLTLNDLNVTFGGASVTGTGAMTFDNSDLTTIPGMPRPTGEVNIAINGANGLIDRLVQIGLIPEDQAMMPRMMLGMFATPVGDDQLTSKIEFTADGQLLANGQRLQ